MIKKRITRFLLTALRRLGLIPPYRGIRVDDVPEKVEDGVLYLIGESGQSWQAAFRCPCGCNETIQLPLTQDAHPRWVLQGALSHPTLAPSVHRTVGCRSHFFLRKGHIVWCPGTKT